MKKKHKIWYLEHFQCILMAKNGLKSPEKPLNGLDMLFLNYFGPLWKMQRLMSKKNIFLLNIFIFRSKKWSKIGPKLVYHWSKRPQTVPSLRNSKNRPQNGWNLLYFSLPGEKGGGGSLKGWAWKYLAELLKF